MLAAVVIAFAVRGVAHHLEALSIVIRPHHLLLLLLSAVGAFASAQQAPQFPAPAPEHALLERFVGSWSATHECTFNGETTTSAGSMRSRIFGDRWAVNEVEIGEGAEAMLGLQVIGYDPKKGKYVGTWTGSVDNHLWVYEGEYDQKTQTLKLQAEGPSMTGDGATTLFSDQYRFVEDGVIEATLLAQDENGAWVTFMTGTLKRNAD